MQTWQCLPTRVPTPRDVVSFFGYREDAACPISETRFVNLLPSVPLIRNHLLVTSTFHTPVTLSPEVVAGEGGTFTFDGATKWFEVGLQVLLASGWRPDCVMGEVEDVTRVVPPAGAPRRPMVFGAPHATKWLSAEDLEHVGRTAETAVRVLEVEVCSFFEEGVGYTCACCRGPEGRALAQGWVVGADNSLVAPTFLSEAAAFHALGPVLTRLQTPG